MIKYFCFIGLLFFSNTFYAEEKEEVNPHLEALEKFVQDYRATEKLVESGTKQASDLNDIYNEIENKVKNERTYTTDALVIMFEKGQQLFESKEYDKCITTLKAIKPLYGTQCDNALNKKIKSVTAEKDTEKDTEKQKVLEAQLEALKDLKESLFVAVTDSEKVIGDVYYLRMKKMIKEKANPDDILSVGDKALDSYENHIWGLNLAWALRVYGPLLQIYTELAKIDKENYDESRKFFLDAITANKQINDGPAPILTVTLNPETIPLVFSTYSTIISNEKNPGTAVKKYLVQLEKNLDVSWDPKKYRGYKEADHKGWHMKDQLNVELTKLCIAFMNHSTTNSNTKKQLQTMGKKYIISVSTDSEKSKYARDANKLRRKVGLPAVIVYRDYKNLFSGVNKLEYLERINYLETLLPATGPNSPERAEIWFWIAVNHYTNKNYLSATFAFERSQIIHPNWGSEEAKKQANGAFGERAFSVMLNAANKYFSAINNKDSEMYKGKENFNKLKSAKQSNRKFIQSVRKQFLENLPKDLSHIDKELIVSTGYLYSRDAYFSLVGNKEASYEDYETHYTLLGNITKEQKYYIDALYYRFQCTFKIFSLLPESETEKKAAMFTRATQDAQLLMANAGNYKNNSNVPKYVANSQITLIQVNLGQDDPKYLNDNIRILSNLKEKYGNILDEKVLAKIPEWQISTYIKLGDGQSLLTAFDVWDKWQKETLSKQKTLDENSYQKIFDQLIRGTTTLMNKGFKIYLTANEKDKKDPYADVKTADKTAIKWLKNNVTLTPSLLIRMIMNSSSASEKVSSCEEYLNEWENNWKDPSNKYHEQAKGPNYGTYNLVCKWQVDSYINIGSAESFQKAAVCYANYYKRNRRDSHRLNEALYTLKAAELFAKTKSKIAKDLFASAATKYGVLRRKIEKDEERGLFCSEWWDVYGQIFLCRIGEKNFELVINSMKSLRSKIGGNQPELRAWFIERLEYLKLELAKNFKGAKLTSRLSHVNDLIRRTKADEAEYLKSLEEEKKSKSQEPKSAKGTGVSTNENGNN